MADYLVKADFKTHIYAELITEITRSDDDICTAAISESITTAKGYLSRFNRTKLFDPDNAAFVNDPQLLACVKDIAVWRMIRLANTGIRLELARTNYEDAIAWLKDVQKGIVDPESWPAVDDDADTDMVEKDRISYTSNEKRNNHY